MKEMVLKWNGIKDGILWLNDKHIEKDQVIKTCKKLQKSMV